MRGWSVAHTARVFGIAETNVRKAKREGRIECYGDGSINPRSALEYWGRHLDAGRLKELEAEIAAEEVVVQDEGVVVGDITRVRNQAKAQQDVIKLKILELEYAIKLGKYVLREDVERDVFEVFSYLREQLEVMVDEVVLRVSERHGVGVGDDVRVILMDGIGPMLERVEAKMEGKCGRGCD